MFPPNPAPLLLRLRHATGGVAAAMADRATQGRPKNPAKSTLLQCCASNRGRGGRQLTMPLAGPAAPRPRARGTRPLELSLGDRRSLDRAHVDISADLASAIVKGVPANFSRSASPRRAIWVMTNRVPQAKGPKQKADGSRMLRAVSQTRRPVAIRVTDLGEPRRLPRVLRRYLD